MEVEQVLGGNVAKELSNDAREVHQEHVDRALGGCGDRMGGQSEARFGPDQSSCCYRLCGPAAAQMGDYESPRVMGASGEVTAPMRAQEQAHHLSVTHEHSTLCAATDSPTLTNDKRPEQVSNSLRQARECRRPQFQRLSLNSCTSSHFVQLTVPTFEHRF